METIFLLLATFLYEMFGITIPILILAFAVWVIALFGVIALVILYQNDEWSKLNQSTFIQSTRRQIIRTPPLRFALSTFNACLSVYLFYSAGFIYTAVVAFTISTLLALYSLFFRMTQ